MRRFFTFLLALTVGAGTLFAKGGKCGDNVRWDLTNGVLTISGTGPMTNYSNNGAPWRSDRSSIKSIVIENGVTRIGDFVFYMCSKVSSVTFANSVTSIGFYAFADCYNLHSVIIPNSVTNIGEYAFLECYGLTSLSIGDGVTSIGVKAFSSCSGLTYLSIGESVTSIGNYAFYRCSALKSVVWKARKLYDAPFHDASQNITSFTFGDKVVDIPNNLCKEMTQLTKITIPNSVTSIGDYVFSGCTGLTSVSIGESVTSIGSSVFEGCTALKSIVWNARNCSSAAPFSQSVAQNITSFSFGDKVERIPNSLCNGMNRLTSITIPNSVISMGNYVFSGCTGLTSLIIPESVTSIGSSVFEGCTGLISVSIGESVTSIVDDAFKNCSGLKYIVWNARNYTESARIFYNLCKNIMTFTFGNNVENIPNFLCSGMSRLTSLTIPNSVTSIGDEAFKGCTGLTSVSIGESVTRIGNGAFSDCTGLAKITSNATTPPTCGGDCFYKVNKTIPLIVPAISVAQYMSAKGWQDFSLQPSSQSGSCGSNLTWTFEEGVLTISGTGAMDTSEPTPWDGFRDFIERVVIKNGVTSISSFKNCTHLSSIEIPSSVTSIGQAAFSGCSSLEELSLTSVKTIPAELCLNCTSLTTLSIGKANSIAEDAFMGCPALNYISVSGTNTAYSTSGGVLYNKSNTCLEKCPPAKGSYTFPSSVTFVEPTAFSDCPTGFSVTCESTTPPTLTSGTYLFASAKGTVNVYVPEAAISDYLTAWGTYKCSYYGLQYGTCTVGGLKYEYHSDGTATVLPNTPKYSGDITVPATFSYSGKTYKVTELGLSAFSYCPDLTSVSLPNTLEIIRSSAFSNSTQLSSISIPENVTSVSFSAFMNCTGLKEIYFKPYNAVPSTGAAYFLSIPEDILIYVPVVQLNEYKARWSEMTNIQPEPIEVNGLYYSIDTEKMNATVLPHPKGDGGYDPLVNITVPETLKVYGMTFSVDTIGEEAFRYCEDILSVTLPNSLVCIDGYAFYNCTAMTKVNIPDGVTSIGDRAFMSCEKMSSFTIPAHVATIGSWVFASCTGLKSITSQATTPPACSSYCFRNVDKSIPLTVPAASVGAYRAANEWKDFTCIQADLPPATSCAEVNIALDGTPVSISSADVIYASDPYVYIQDETGTTLLYLKHNDSRIEPGVHISGIQGVVDIFSGLPEVKPSNQDDWVVTASGSVVPSIVSLDDEPTAAMVNQLVYIPKAALEGTFTSSSVTNLTLKLQNGKTAVLRNQFKFDEVFSSNQLYDIIAAVAVYNTTVQLYFIQVVTSYNLYNIRFLNEDGTVLQESLVPNGTLPVYEGETPVKAETDCATYEFAGWNKPIYPAYENLDYTAVFEELPNRFHVTFMSDNDTILKDYLIFCGVELNAPEIMAEFESEMNLTKEPTAQYTYTFIGWSPEPEVVTTHAIYTAVYDSTLRSYTVTWINWDGTTLAEESYKYGATPSFKGSTPVRPATAENTFTFTGWSPEISEVTGDVTYKAQYSATGQTYTVTWKMDDGSVIAKETYAYGDMPNYEGPVKEATAQYTYTFTGWTPAVVAVTGDATYTAVYEATLRSYTVSWRDWDNPELAHETYAYGETPTYKGPTPTREASPQYTYTFSGWSPAVVPVTDNAVYTAVYTETVNTYTVIWQNWDGTQLAKEEYEYGATPTYKGATPTKEGTDQYSYTFSGWSPAVEPVTRDETYTAEFTKDDARTVVSVITFTNFLKPTVGAMLDAAATAGALVAPEGAKYYAPYTMGKFLRYNETIDDDEYVENVVATEGVYRFTVQVRIDQSNSLLYRLPTFEEDLTVSVDGEAWEVLGDPYITDSYSFAWILSPRFTISASTEGINEVPSNQVQSTKVIRDGHLLILRGDKIYTVTGQEIR